MRRRVAVAFWRVVNPLARLGAGRLPFWVLVETTGRRTGRPRRTPLAAGPRDPDGAMWLIAVHGRHSGWVLNVDAQPACRFRHRGRWYDATGQVLPYDESVVRRFNAYARSGPRTLGIDPLLVKLTPRS